MRRRRQVVIAVALAADVALLVLGIVAAALHG